VTFDPGSRRSVCFTDGGTVFGEFCMEMHQW
jgi:hypothetical protein